jgi:GT2 family glycosyltransferase
MREEAPRVSVVIATYNSRRTIERCLLSIKNQTCPPLEIIVVDALRYDEREQRLCRQLIERHATYLQDGPERSIQRNRGIREAYGEFICVLDQDHYLEPNVLAECIEALTTKNAVAVTIPEISIGEGFWSECVAFERYVSTYLSDGLNECCRFFRKKDVLAIGGYDPAIVGAEDSDLHYRLQALGPIMKIKTHTLHDEGRTRFWNRVKKKYYYSAAFREYLRRRPQTAVRQFFPIKPAYFKHYRVLLKRPIVTMGMALLRAAEVAAGCLGLLMRR